MVVMGARTRAELQSSTRFLDTAAPASHVLTPVHTCAYNSGSHAGQGPRRNDPSRPGVALPVVPARHGGEGAPPGGAARLLRPALRRQQPDPLPGRFVQRLRQPHAPDDPRDGGDRLGPADRPQPEADRLRGRPRPQAGGPLRAAGGRAAMVGPASVMWDPVRAQTHRRTHRIDWADLVAAFVDERALTIPDSPTAVDEPRFVTLGRDARARTVVVAYARRRGAIRILSARPATPRERRQYLEKDA